MRARFLPTCLVSLIGLSLIASIASGDPVRTESPDGAPAPDDAIAPEDGGIVVRPAPSDGTIPFVIVTDRMFVPEFRRLARAHARAGLAAALRTVQQIHAAYPAGRDDAERIRMFLKDARAGWGAQWVLLAGDDPIVPMRRAYLRTRLLNLGDIRLPTDQYYACLGGTWNADGDDLWGELPDPELGEPGDDVDLVPALDVGRAPVTTREEARVFVDKTLNALGGPADRAPASVLLAASYSFVDYAAFTELLVPVVASDPAARLTRLYQNWTQWPGSVEETRARVIDALDQGYDLTVLAGPGGHGLYAAGDQSHELLPASDLLGLTSQSAPGHVFALSAYTNEPGTLSIGAALLRAPRGGAVTVVGTTDIQLSTSANVFMGEFFREANLAAVTTIGEALRRTIVTVGADFPAFDLSRLTYQGYLLLGDPALPPPGRPGVAARASGRGGIGVATGAPTVDAATPVLGIPFPNPASSFTRVELVAPASAVGAAVETSVLDVAGRHVRALARDVARPGSSSLEWDLRDDAGRRVGEGLYFMRVSVGAWSRVTRIAVLR